MEFCPKEETVRLMNRWGSERRPFFFLISYDETECLVVPPEEICRNELLFAFPLWNNVEPLPETHIPDFRWDAFPQPFEAYKHSFDVVRGHLLAGNSFLANLTCATPVHTNLSLEDIFYRSNARYRLLLKGRFVVFSPETFVRVKNGMVYSYPMKGTIDATIPHAKEILLHDEKESAEHATITDLIRNDLSRIATEVTVTRYKYIDELHTHHGSLLQMSSEIRGQLPCDYREHLGDLFFSLLPAGSITGAPKKKTVEIIAEAEGYRRGFYTGVTGYFDGSDLDSAVMIRFLEQLPDGGMVYKSGGGITFRSNATSEYEEMKKKIYVPID